MTHQVGRYKHPVEFTALRCNRLLLENSILDEAPEGGKKKVEESSGLTFNTFITELAKKWAGETEKFIWNRCPKGVVHTKSMRFVGTVKEYSLGSCDGCQLISSHATYRSALKGLDQYVIKDEDLDIDLSYMNINTRCSNCEFAGTHPFSNGYPLCATCVATGGKCYGALIKRPLEGVTCENELLTVLESWLSKVGIESKGDYGIVVPTYKLKPTYYKYPVIKPSLVIPQYQICVDIYTYTAPYETDGKQKLEINTTPTSMYADDSKIMAFRATSLKAIGWKYLVISSYELEKLVGIENLLYKSHLYSSGGNFASRVFDDITDFIKVNKLIRNSDSSANIHTLRKFFDGEMEDIRDAITSFPKTNTYKIAVDTLEEILALLEADKRRYERYVSNSILIDSV